MNSRNFRGPFYDDVIYRDDSYLWSSEEIKIKAKRPEVDVGDVWNLVGFEMSSRKITKIKIDSQGSSDSVRKKQDNTKIEKLSLELITHFEVCWFIYKILYK